MKGQAIVVIAGAFVALWGAGNIALAIQACPNADSCAEVKVDVGTPGALKVGDTFVANLLFKQGPDSGQAGGIDKIAALALTLGIPGTGSGAPLTLASCALNGDNFPADDVTPDPSVSNFKVVVENASCANGRTHCLCPDAGQARDNFINLVIYGPNPLPTPGVNPIDIPTLPPGPQTWVTLKLKVAAGASGEIPLHVINQVADGARPPFTAFLSVGDKLAVDQTCVPIPGQPPCSAAESVSQVQITDAGVTVKGCVGDCDGRGTVTVDEIIILVDIALGSMDPATCLAGDPGGDGVQITDIVTAVDNALAGCR